MERDTSNQVVVLVIDDAVATRRRLCALLSEQAGVEAVGCAATPASALRRAAELAPGCVVIDVPVHDEEGFALLRRLRQLDASAVIIVLTNHVTQEFERRSIDAGVNHFLAKSTEFERVVDLVAELALALTEKA